MYYYDPYRYNPISKGRQKKLIGWLKDTLMRPCEGEFRRYAAQLGMVADADPTHSGKYSRWILGQLVVGGLRFPDDVMKVHDLLVDFHRIKSRIPVEHRDITHYSSFSQLYDVVTASIPRVPSKTETRIAGTNTLYSDDIWTLIQLTSLEAVVKASQNTGWCTCDVDTAKRYLDDGELYVVLREGERFLLISPNSDEIMLANNSPYTDCDRSLFLVLQEYLPEIICTDHGELITHVECSGCEEVGCRDIKACHLCDENLMCGDCSNFCNHCNKPTCEECSKECSECSEIVCEQCQDVCSSCDAVLCDEHIRKCAECNDAVICHSPDCQLDCVECGNSVCTDCGYTCTVCDSRGEPISACDSCADDVFIQCPACDQHACQPDPDDDKKPCGVNCNDCGDFRCMECIEAACATCRGSLCVGCANSCPCGNEFCKDCGFYCRCGEHLCGECKEFTCEMCGMELCLGCMEKNWHSCSFR